MKIKNLFTGLLVASILIITGCAGTLTKSDPGPRRVSQPVFSVDPVTHQPYVSGTTNVEVTGPQYVVNPNVAALIAAVQQTLGVAATVPSPLTPVFGGLSILLGGVGAVLGIYAKRKSGELTLSNAALAATATTIETADNAFELKSNARVAAQANGSQDYLHNQVKNL